MIQRVALALRLLLGAVFIYAAYTKLRQSWLLFALSIDSYQLLPEWAVFALARTLPALELALGVLLIAGVWLRYLSIVAAAILALFFSVMVVCTSAAPASTAAASALASRCRRRLCCATACCWRAIALVVFTRRPQSISSDRVCSDACTIYVAAAVVFVKRCY